MKYSHLLAAILVGAVATSAHAGGDWTFADATHNGDWSNPHTFLDSASVGIIATGWDVQNGLVGNEALNYQWHPGTLTAHDLYGKYTSGDPTETGLGLSNVGGNDTDFEIEKDQLVQLNLTNAIAAYGSTFSMEFSSLQTGEGYSLFGSTGVNSPFTLLSDGFGNAQGTNTVSVNLAAGGYKYVEISAYGTLTEGDDLVMNVVHQNPPSPTPEPFTIGLGIAGIGIAVRRRMQKA